MRRVLSICVPTIGRKTLEMTLESCKLAQSGFMDQVELSVFLNGFNDFSILKKYVSTITVLSKSESRLPPWISMRQSLKALESDYYWLIGDDDLVKLTTFRQLLGFLKESTADLILLNAIDDDYKGTQKNAAPHLIESVSFSSSSEMLKELSKELNILNNGRFIVSKRLRDLMLDSEFSNIETYHEEYRAIFESLNILIERNGFIEISGFNDSAVVLGNVTKSWSSVYFEAQIGEAFMYKTLSKSFSPVKDFVAERILSSIFKFRSLVWYRERLNAPIQATSYFEILSSIRKSKLLFINALPIFLVKTLNLFFIFIEKVQVTVQLFNKQLLQKD